MKRTTTQKPKLKRKAIATLEKPQLDKIAGGKTSTIEPSCPDTRRCIGGY